MGDDPILDDAEAVAREFGDFMVMRQTTEEEGGEPLMEALPAKISHSGNAVFLYLGEEIYAMKLDELRQALGAPPDEAEE